MKQRSCFADPAGEQEAEGHSLKQTRQQVVLRTLSEVGMREQRLPSSPSTAFPAFSSALREDAVVLAGAQASTTCSPSTKHSGSLLPWLSGTQSSSSESLRTRLREAKESRRHHERWGHHGEAWQSAGGTAPANISEGCKAALLERNSPAVGGRKSAHMGHSVRENEEPLTRTRRAGGSALQ